MSGCFGSGANALNLMNIVQSNFSPKETVMYQKIIIVGNLGRDPEMRYMPDGQAVTNLSIATNRKWTDNATGELQEEVTWFRASVWGKQAEAANEYLTKGRQVMVEGRIKPDPDTGGPRLWTRQDGSVGASFEIVASRVQFLGSNGNGNGNGQHSSVPAEETSDIPF
jgi:single-strand DNA-binding protein